MREGRALSEEAKALIFEIGVTLFRSSPIYGTYRLFGNTHFVTIAGHKRSRKSAEHIVICRRVCALMISSILVRSYRPFLMFALEPKIYRVPSDGRHLRARLRRQRSES